MRKIFLYGYYGFHNFGDDLLLKTIIENINKDVSFKVRSLDEGPILRNNIVYTCVDRILNRNGSKNKVFKFTTYVFKLLKESFECDTLIVGGGTLIHDNHSIGNILILFLLVTYSLILQKKIFFIGLGVSELKHVVSKLILKFFVKISNGFCVRDKESYDLLKNYGCDIKKITQTSDLVYSLSHMETRIKKSKKGKNIGITLVDGAMNNAALKRTIIEYIKMLISGNDINVMLLSLQNMNNLNDKYNISDLSLMLDIREELTFNAEKVKVQEVSLDSFENTYRHLDLVVGMRFHSLLLAALHGIPFVGVIHDKKILSICNTFSMPYVDCGEMSAVDLYKKSLMAMNNSINIEILNEKILCSKENFAFKRM